MSIKRERRRIYDSSKFRINGFSTMKIDAQLIYRPHGWKFNPLDFVVPVALIFALLPSGIYLSLLLIIAIMLCGRVLDGLSATVILTLANPALFNTGDIGLLRYIPLALGLVLIWPKGRVVDIGVALVMLGCASILTLNSLVVSQLPSVSFFKGLLFIIMIWTLFNTNRVDWISFSARVDQFIPVYLIFSIPFVAVPSVGFLVNGTGFQGLTNQPQVFGVWMALCASWLLYRTLKNRCAIPRAWAISVISGLLFCIVLSEARTALLGFAAAAFTTIFLIVLQSPKRFGLRLLLSMGLLTSAIFVTQSSDTLERFIFKRSQANDILSAVQASRGLLVERSLENFKANPLLGIGFGVPSDLATAEISYAPIIDLPISVELEKGLWISAALEEQGIVGTIAISLLFLSFLVYSISHRSWMGLPLLAYFLTSNLGEMTMFSMGGTGQLQWILLMASFKTFEVPSPNEGTVNEKKEN